MNICSGSSKTIFIPDTGKKGRKGCSWKAHDVVLNTVLEDGTMFWNFLTSPVSLWLPVADISSPSYSRTSVWAFDPNKIQIFCTRRCKKYKMNILSYHIWGSFIRTRYNKLAEGFFSHVQLHGESVFIPEFLITTLCTVQSPHLTRQLQKGLQPERLWKIVHISQRSYNITRLLQNIFNMFSTETLFYMYLWQLFT